MAEQNIKLVNSISIMSVACLLFSATYAEAESPPEFQVAGVYGAQSHVIDLNDQTYTTVDDQGNLTQKLFPMLADRDMLFKVNLIQLADPATTDITDVEVTVTLKLHDETETIVLDPPINSSLPTSFDTNPASIQHTFFDSFTTTISEHWMKPGLKWQIGWCHSIADARHCTIEAEQTVYVRPPIKMTINVFPFELFGWSWRNVNASIDALLAEMAQKLPVSELVVRKPEIDYYKMDEVLIPAELNNPPRLINNRIMDGKLVWGNINVQGTMWNKALYQAAGINYNTYSATYMLMGMHYPGGKGVGATNAMTTSIMPRPGNYGIAWHESLHMYGLNHWGQRSRVPVGTGVYPFIGEYLGIDAPDENNLGHIGPAWGYDSRDQLFLPPTIIQSNGYPRWRVVPEKLGNQDAHWDMGMKLTPLSLWSAVRIMERYGNRPAWFDATEDSYWVEQSGWHRYDWDQDMFVQATVSQNDRGFKLPAPYWPGSDVYTVLIQASTATEYLVKRGGEKISDIPRIAKIYPPIGPYKTNIKTRVNPAGQYRNWALKKGMCNETTSFCDFSIRVKRNGNWAVYVLDRDVDWSAEAQTWREGVGAGNSFITVAINLPVSEGEIEEAQLLLTPNVLQNAWPSDPEVLGTWTK